jgi:hypothetical protein
MVTHSQCPIAWTDFEILAWLRLGPFLRADFLFIDRTFPSPAGDTQNSSASIKINIINIPMGLMAHVAF